MENIFTKISKALKSNHKLLRLLCMMKNKGTLLFGRFYIFSQFVNKHGTTLTEK